MSNEDENDYDSSSLLVNSCVGFSVVKDEHSFVFVDDENQNRNENSKQNDEDEDNENPSEHFMERRQSFIVSKSPIDFPLHRHLEDDDEDIVGKEDENDFSPIIRKKKKLRRKARIPGLNTKELSMSIKHYGFYLGQAFQFIPDINQWKVLEEDIASTHVLSLEPTKYLRDLIRSYGIPPNLRGEVWCKITNTKKRLANDMLCYSDLLNEYCERKSIATDQIDKDILRTWVGDCSAKGREELRSVLVSYSWFNPEVGYCQSMNVFVSLLLMYIPEEQCFWMLHSIITDLLEPGFYSQNLSGLLVEMMVLNHLVQRKIPRLHDHFKKYDVSLDSFAPRWFLSIFVTCFPIETTLRIFDCFFCEGGTILLRIVLAMLKIHEKNILLCKTFVDIMEFIRDLPTKFQKPDLLLETSFKVSVVGRLRKSRLKKLRAEFKQRLLDDDDDDDDENDEVETEEEDYGSFSDKNSKKKEEGNVDDFHLLEIGTSPSSPPHPPSSSLSNLNFDNDLNLISKIGPIPLITENENENEKVQEKKKKNEECILTKKIYRNGFRIPEIVEVSSSDNEVLDNSSSSYVSNCSSTTTSSTQEQDLGEDGRNNVEHNHHTEIYYPLTFLTQQNETPQIIEDYTQSHYNTM